jgi:hypothetical protein
MRRIFSWISLLIFAVLSVAQGEPAVQRFRAFREENRSYISAKKGTGRFALSASGSAAPLVVSSSDFPGVLRVAKLLQADIQRVTDVPPDVVCDSLPSAAEIVLIGTLGKNPLLDRLVREKKLDVNDIAGRWETFLLQVVEKPFPGIKRALVIAGSDKRGAIYGMFDLSAQIGVSPWYWWADVPIRHQKKLFVLPGRHSLGEPAVKYRGIFLNDEEPALGRWAVEKFGGFNSQFYEKLFELMLRMKANYLWPAMWWASFNSDDPMNPKLADEYGIVMGTTHHEPMMRAHAEWKPYGGGAWNYETNAAQLRAFWTEGIQRMDSHESIITLAMRGDGDMAMTESTNIALLEKIVADQREILGRVTGKDVRTIPQIWALYKEVQEYYDKGMRVPDDVTLLLCDDNWGNLRKLPALEDPPRSGGYGIYYHFDYVGGPRNYKWLNTNQISRVWEQMNLAYRYGVDRIWIVNVGDLKPMEFPTEFFLDFAWNPDNWPAERLPEYTRLWAERQFGSEHAAAIADILTQYTRYNSRRKPELLAPDTYSLLNFREAETVVADYNRLAEMAERIAKLLPPEYRDAFYQLVLHPVLACANLNDLYVTVAKNRLYAAQGRAATNELAARAKALFDKDAELSRYYNTILAGGKWNHFMDQTHIGYTYWQQPEKNTMPQVEEISVPEAAGMGVAEEGTELFWPQEKSEADLPEFDHFQRQSFYLEVFNRGQSPFSYKIQCEAPWLVFSPQQGVVEKETRVLVSVLWQKAPSGEIRAPITINGPNGTQVVVYAAINNPPVPEPITGFFESTGCISIEAEHYSRTIESASAKWLRIPDLGRTLSAMTPWPVNAPSQSPGDSPRLEYDLYTFHSGEIKVRALLSPTLNFHNSDGLRYAVSIDDEPPQIINMHADFSFQDWEEAVRRNIIEAVSTHQLAQPGAHVLKIWMVDAGVVLQKLIIEMDEGKPSYLGPPETFYQTERSRD